MAFELLQEQGLRYPLPAENRQLVRSLLSIAEDATACDLKAVVVRRPARQTDCQILVWKVEDWNPAVLQNPYIQNQTDPALVQAMFNGLPTGDTAEYEAKSRASIAQLRELVGKRCLVMYLDQEDQQDLEGYFGNLSLKALPLTGRWLVDGENEYIDLWPVR